MLSYCLNHNCSTKVNSSSLLRRAYKRLDSFPSQQQIIHLIDTANVQPKSLNQIANYIQTLDISPYFNEHIDPPQIVHESDHYSYGINYMNGKIYLPSHIAIHPILLTSVCLHEAMPGHHFMYKQLGDQFLMTTDGRPNDVLIEGWGLYVERFYPNTFENKVGYIVGRMMRTIRAIIDINYHNQTWNEEQCIEFLREHWPFYTTSSNNEEIQREIDRMKDMPGYNASYLVGELFFERLWHKYGKEMGIKKFHTTLFNFFKKHKNKISMRMIDKEFSSLDTDDWYDEVMYM